MVECKVHGPVEERWVLAVMTREDKPRFFCLTCVAELFAREGVAEVE